MIDIELWLNDFLDKVGCCFKERIWFIGLQGSYGRGEACETSDIDVVVILDKLNIVDLKHYNDMLDTLPYREKVCGFIAGKAELLSWDPADLFQFYNDTTPLKGSLDILLERIDKNAVKRAVSVGACNIYHACVHNYVCDKCSDNLKMLYKSASFVIQAKWFYESGEYLKTKKELLLKINNKDKQVLEVLKNFKSCKEEDLESLSNILLLWASNIIISYKQ